MTKPEYPQVGGKHPETAALTNILASLGVTAPHTRQPYSEAMLLGIGGGIGGGYWLFEFTGNAPVLVLGTRHEWQYRPGEFLRKVADRVGAGAEVKESSTPNAASKRLDEVLEAGRPAFAAVDLASMPYLLMPDHLAKCFYHAVTIIGHSDIPGHVLIDDRARVPLSVDRAELAAARGAITSVKNRLIVVDPPEAASALESAVRAGLRDCAEGLLNPPIRNFGVAAWEKWADLLTSQKDKKGWPRSFPPGPRLYMALTATWQAIETDGTGGSAMRGMFAEFLDEAHAVLGDAYLRSQANEWQAIAQRWTALAEAALPDGTPLAQAKRLFRERSALFEEYGDRRPDDMRAINHELAALERAMEDDFPLSPATSRELLEDLRVRLLDIHRLETTAADELHVLGTAGHESMRLAGVA